MVLMAIDHASLFIAHKHSGEFWGLALPQYQTALEFLTRFVTHLCAPGFFFLTGVGMMLFAHSRRELGWTEQAIRRHYIKRGLLLIVLQLFVENPAWAMGPISDVGPQPPGGGGSVIFHFGVLYGLGAAMIVSVLLLRFSAKVLIGISILAVLVTQALIPGPENVGTLYSPLIRLLLVPGHTNLVQVFYPLVPWVGLAIFGLVFANLILSDPAAATRKAVMIGASFLLLFLVVRFGGGFGNIHPAEGSGWIAFLNVTKYPPSLAFVLLALGIDLLLLAFFSRVVLVAKRWIQPLLVFGQTALFFYIAHLYLYAVMGLILFRTKGTTIAWMYLYWALGLLILYPLCVQYRKFKQGKAPESVWRFF